VLRSLGRLAEAERAFRDAIALEPDFVEAIYNLGGTLQALGRSAEAQPLLRRVLELLSTTGLALAKEGNFAEALGCYQRALELAPDDPGLLNQAGVVLDGLGRYAEALPLLRRAQALRPADVDVAFNIAMALLGQGDFPKAIESFEAVLRMAPEHGEAALSKALTRLSMGDFARGWAEYEVRYTGRFAYPRVTKPALDFPMWRGEPLKGKRILLVGEQGFGDQVQFIRYAQVLADMGATVDAAVDVRVHRLLATAPGLRRVLAAIPQDEHGYDYWSLLMSVPLHLGTRLETIPGRVPYVRAPEEETRKWAARLAGLPRDRPKVGLVWTGRDRKINRTMAFEALAPLAQIDGLSFIGMQFGEQPPAGNFPHLQLGPEIGDFADQAALLANLDLLVTVDTAVGHVAGALGLEHWVMLPFHPDWRWIRGLDHSPWYPRAKIYRQPAFGDWASVVAQVAQGLRSFRAARA
jgi:Flp pilus assembly protein TadD